MPTRVGSSLLNRLTKIGFTISADELLTSLTAARMLVADRKLNPLLLLSESAQEEFSDLVAANKGKAYDSVVIGLAPDALSYPRLNEAFRLLHAARASGGKGTLIATHRARYFADSDGQLSLGPGVLLHPSEVEMFDL